MNWKPHSRYYTEDNIKTTLVLMPQLTERYKGTVIVWSVKILYIQYFMPIARSRKPLYNYYYYRRTHVNYWLSVMRNWEGYAVNWSATNSRPQRRLPIRPSWLRLWTRAMDMPGNWKNYYRLGSWR